MNPGRLASIAYFRSTLYCTQAKLAEAAKIDKPTNFAGTLSLHSFLSLERKRVLPSPAQKSRRFSGGLMFINNYFLRRR